MDEAPVEEIAELGAKDEVCCATESIPNLRIKQIKTRTVAGEVSDARDWGVMELAVWELELAESKGKFAGLSTSERFFKKRLEP